MFTALTHRGGMFTALTHRGGDACYRVVLVVSPQPVPVGSATVLE